MQTRTNINGRESHTIVGSLYANLAMLVLIEVYGPESGLPSAAETVAITAWNALAKYA